MSIGLVMLAIAAAVLSVTGALVNLYRLVEWFRTLPAPKRDLRAEIVQQLAQIPVTAIAVARDGDLARVAGTVVNVDPLVIDDGSGIAAVDLDGRVTRWLFRGRYEVGQPLTVSAVIRRHPDLVPPLTGPYRDRAAARARLVSTIRHAVTVTDEVELVARNRSAASRI